MQGPGSSFTFGPAARSDAKFLIARYPINPRPRKRNQKAFHWVPGSSGRTHVTARGRHTPASSSAFGLRPSVPIGSFYPILKPCPCSGPGAGICFCLPAPDLRPRPPAGPVPINCSLCLGAAWCLKASARPLRPSPPEKGSSPRPGRPLFLYWHCLSERHPAAYTQDEQLVAQSPTGAGPQGRGTAERAVGGFRSQIKTTSAPAVGPCGPGTPHRGKEKHKAPPPVGDRALCA